MHVRSSLLPAALLSSLVFLTGADGGCGDPILENNGFDLWCGESLCYWELEEGDVARISTWHKSDHGIELRGNVAAISQLSNISSSTECLRLRAVANVEETATLTVEIDYFDDGVIDVSERVPTSDWAPISLLSTPPRVYRGARFRIRKTGAGTAQLAELVVEEADKCVEPPAAAADRAAGALCLSHAECATGLCEGLPDDAAYPGVCGECAGDEDCASGEVCGLIEPEPAALLPFRGCQAPATDILGQACATGAECGTGICFGAALLDPKVCSSCAFASDCDGEATCDPIVIEHPDVVFGIQGPYMCSPYDGAYPSGEPCLLDESCASGACEGPTELQVCATDGRLCDDDDDCFRDQPCVAVGTAGGTCR